MSRRRSTTSGPQGLARQFRAWADGVDPKLLPEVPGATDEERARLALLGGVARAVAGSRTTSWPQPCQEWVDTAPEPDARLVNGVLAALVRGDDPFSVLYDASISSKNRRRLGTVFTPQPVVDYMLTLARDNLSGPPELVVDPGAGVGAFTLAAIRSWPTSSVVAVDVNPVTLGLLAARLVFESGARPDLAKALDRVELVLGNYLDELDSIYSDQASVLVLGNPPYTRIQELSGEDRRKAARMSQDVIDSGHANLAMTFLGATFQRMRAGDVTSMVLPGSFSYTRAGRGLRQALWASKKKLRLDWTPATTAVFPGRAVQAAIVTIGRTQERRTPLRVVNIEITGTGVDLLEDRSVLRSGPEPENWFGAPEGETLPSRDTIPLSQIAQVRRGTATGASQFFFLTDEAAKDLPKEVLLPAVPSLRHIDSPTLTFAEHSEFGGSESPRWLLAVPPDFKLSGQLRTYIEQHQEAIAARYLPSRRAVWYSVHELPRPEILVSPLTTRNFKIVVNEVGAIPSNNVFGLTMLDGFEKEPLVRWLRSSEGQAELRRTSRRYPGGSFKLEPGVLADAQVPQTLASTRR